MEGKKEEKKEGWKRNKEGRKKGYEERRKGEKLGETKKDRKM